MPNKARKKVMRRKTTKVPPIPVIRPTALALDGAHVSSDLLPGLTLAKELLDRYQANFVAEAGTDDWLIKVFAQILDGYRMTLDTTLSRMEGH